MASLRSKLIAASILWTAGLLALMHMTSMYLIRGLPKIQGAHLFLAVCGAVAAMVGGMIALRGVIHPFRRVGERLAAVRTARSARVDGAYPSEVQPLIDELNGLLEDREKTVKRALATAGDLAHGLKTPLAVLAQEADRAAAAGDREMADRIGQQVDRMLRQVNYHLARARAASGAGAEMCGIAVSADGIARTLSKIYADRRVRIEAEVPPELSVRVRREDLEEILGNLLDNACKWSKSRIVVSARREGAMVLVTVDDDGPGVAPEMRAKVLERGVRMDEAAPGSGLGLAIVRDLVELYGGALGMEQSAMGGLRVRAILPAQATSQT